uniref:Uncharacterized protein n=1 Tax=Solanum lycopersicum TaxID=4081 RepID=A0A3Q7IAY8_SOLLC
MSKYISYIHSGGFRNGMSSRSQLKTPFSRFYLEKIEFVLSALVMWSKFNQTILPRIIEFSLSGKASKQKIVLCKFGLS